MPLYEFICNKCNFEFEEILKVDSENPKCSKCNSEVSKKISRIFCIIKGSEHRLLDCVVGEDSEKRWKSYEKRKQKRLLKKHIENQNKGERKNVLC